MDVTHVDGVGDLVLVLHEVAAAADVAVGQPLLVVGVIVTLLGLLLGKGVSQEIGV